jgi:HPt (histidine-containing phosphotransfer) domain-containing protein
MEDALDPFEAPIPDPDLILDPEVLATLATIMSHERLIALASSYLNGLIARAGRIAALAATGELGLLGREGHDLKSTSGSFGARRLQYLGETLEAACRDQNRSRIAPLAAEIARVVPETVTAVLRRYPDIPVEAGVGR